MEKDGDALVTPDQAWSEDGTATVAPVSPFPELTPRNLPLDNRIAGNHTVQRSVHAYGLVIIQSGNEPSLSPATLPVFASSGDSVQITDDDYYDWPDGFVIWFMAE